MNHPRIPRSAVLLLALLPALPLWAATPAAEKADSAQRQLGTVQGFVEVQGTASSVTIEHWLQSLNLFPRVPGLRDGEVPAVIHEEVLEFELDE
ncbi:MAG: hypothetical protein KDC10_09560 [Calditrichaeota bacterium]|nr:hypothetical protein [Candidatus Cloacimonadota bacterium]MCA9786907.1 hypothetical protein [Candidatus Cloacimonadota bacterium]MCB1047435.1 hypothetical protein [Calditrichota bacterium]MCB9474713.1 hypothetical protein [Candidatus Delongbacteria bacterium]